MALEVDQPLLERGEVFLVDVLHVDAAVVFHRAHRRHDHRGARPQAGLAAFDVEEFLGAEIGAEARLGDDVVRQLECALGGDHGIAAVSDVGEGAAVDERRVILERLHQVRRERVLQQHRHGSVRLEVARMHRLVVAGVADDDAAEALLQVLERGRQAENRHDLGSHHDIEAVLARIAVGRAAQRHHDVAQRPVVHVHDALPLDAPHVDAQLVALGDVVVQQRRQQVVGQRDRGEIAGEMQVDVFHRHHLRVAAARCAALDAEHRAERRLAQADHGLLADVVERVAQAYGGRGLALARRGRADRRDEDQLAVLFRFQRIEVGQRDLGLVVPVGLQVLLGDAELLEGHLGNALQFRRLGDLDVRWHVHGSRKGVNSRRTLRVTALTEVKPLSRIRPGEF